jgi:hypothetical protein
MAYLKPPAITRKVFNPLAMRFGLGGAVALYVPRRRSGELQKLPVIPIKHDGARYLVSTRGESQWVLNMREAGGGELEEGGRRSRFRATELPVGECEPMIATYRAVAGKTVDTYFKRLPDPADHPVFRIDVVGEAGGEA